MEMMMMDEGEYHKSSKDDGGEWNGIPIERPHHYHFHYQHTNLTLGGAIPVLILRGMSSGLTALLNPSH